jgi:hypothetical protein
MTEPTPSPVTAERPRSALEKPVCRDEHGTGRRGIECPACGCRHFHVLYTRRAVGKRILRRRECRNCGRRITTYESAKG